MARVSETSIQTGPLGPTWPDERRDQDRPREGGRSALRRRHAEGRERRGELGAPTRRSSSRRRPVRRRTASSPFATPSRRRSTSRSRPSASAQLLVRREQADQQDPGRGVQLRLEGAGAVRALGLHQGRHQAERAEPRPVQALRDGHVRTSPSSSPRTSSASSASRAVTKPTFTYKTARSSSGADGRIADGSSELSIAASDGDYLEVAGGRRRLDGSLRRHRRQPFVHLDQAFGQKLPVDVGYDVTRRTSPARRRR